MAGATGAEGGVGQVTGPVHGPGADGGIGQGTGPGQGAGPVHGQSKRTGNISAEKKKELESKYSKATFRGVPIRSKETPTKEKPVKVTPAKVTPDVNPDSMDTESNGKPEKPVVKQTGSKLKEYESDSNFDKGVSAELAKELEKLEKK